MKKVIIFIIVIVLIVAGAFGIYKKINNYNIESVKIINEMVAENIEKEIKDIVIIKNGNIQNENLIDEFLEKTSHTDSKITLIIYDFLDNIKYDEKKIEFYPSSISQTVEEENADNVTIPEEDNLDGFGYYILMINNNEHTKEKFQKMNWYIKRRMENNQVKLIFYSYADVIEFPVICTYNLENSNYKKEIDMSFYQRKDKGIKKVIDKNTSNEYDFDIFTFGGDVNFTVDDDMIYDFQKALEEKTVTIDDILKQAKEDEKYGICESGMYSDGGTIEYRYNDYTILKYDTLDGNKDFVVGPVGEIRYQVDEILYK